MTVNQIRLCRFRNLDGFCFEPAVGVNVIYGANAQGKTNILEALWLFTGCKSFRGAKDRQLVGFGEENALLSLDYFGYDRQQTMQIKIDCARKYVHNGIELKSTGRVIGEVLCVVFSPEHLNLIKGGPKQRRRFVDIALSQLRPSYAGVLTSYNKLLAQRNATLRRLSCDPAASFLLDVWEEKMADCASEIAFSRHSYVQRLFSHAEEIYSGISGEKEKITIKYSTASDLNAADRQQYRERLIEKLSLSRKEDAQRGSTDIGPHRDDLSVKLGGLSIRSFGSQGQQRSAAVALKLSEAKLMQKSAGESPIILLDDVMSELDEQRQRYILNSIEGRQVFITCCDSSQLGRLCGGKRLEIENGRIIKCT